MRTVSVKVFLFFFLLISSHLVALDSTPLSLPPSLGELGCTQTALSLSPSWDNTWGHTSDGHGAQDELWSKAMQTRATLTTPLIGNASQEFKTQVPIEDNVHVKDKETESSGSLRALEAQK